MQPWQLVIHWLITVFTYRSRTSIVASEVISLSFWKCYVLQHRSHMYVLPCLASTGKNGVWHSQKAMSFCAYLCTLFNLSSGRTQRGDFDSKSLSRKVSKTCVSVEESPTIIVGLLFALGEAFASRKKVIKSNTKWAFNYRLLRRKQTED